MNPHSLIVTRAFTICGRFLFTLCLLFSLTATAARAGAIKNCKSSQFAKRKIRTLPPQPGDIPVFPWETLQTRRAKTLWDNIAERVTIMNRSDPRVAPELPKRIPPELIVAFHYLNRVMGDDVRFVKWMIALELEVQDELMGMDINIGSEGERHLQAIKSVIARRAAAAGWPSKIIIYKMSPSEPGWRPMIKEGKLFIDTNFKDSTRNGTPHTAGAHLLQLLYASEVLNAIPELRDSPAFRDKKPMQTLMQFMGDGYLFKGKPFDTDKRLTWITGSDPDGEKSLWRNFFDHKGNGINSPETFGKFYHALPVLKDMEMWAEKPPN